MRAAATFLELYRGRLDLARRVLEPSRGPSVRLTEREIRVVEYLAARQGSPVDRHELYEALWPRAEDVVSRAVDDCIRRLRRKVEITPSDPDHLLSVFGIGYQFVGRSEAVEAASPPAPDRIVRLGPGVLVDLTRRLVIREGRRSALTANEATLIERLADRRDHVVPRGEIVRGIWRSGGARALENLVSRLRTKLEADPAHPEWLLTVRGRGYRLASPPAAAPPSAPPRWLTRLVGRDEDLDALARAVEAHPLVTVCGPPGAGKTRLACALAAVLADRFPGGVVFCAPDRDGEELVAAVARALGVPVAGTAAEIGGTLRLRGRTLLVLDEAERFAPASEAIRAWSGAATVLATSRVPLAVDGELRFPVPPLTERAAVALLLDRARLAAPALRLRDDDDEIAAIVRRLDRIPLALELAARWLAVIPPARLLATLADPSAPLPDDAERTLARAVQRSWDLLSETERQGLLRLLPCAGGVSLEDADALLEGLHPFPLEVLRALTDASLVGVQTRADRVRFRIYDAVARFCWQQVDADERVRLRDRHAARFAASGAALCDGDRPGPDDRHRRLVAEWDNLAAAARHAVGTQRPDRAAAAAAAVLAAAELRGNEAAALALSDAVLAMPGLTDAQRLAVWLARSPVLRETRQREVLRREAIAALAAARRLSDAPSECRALLAHASATDDRTASGDLFREALALAAQTGSALPLGEANKALGSWYRASGQPEAARAHFREAIALGRRVGGPTLGIALMSLGLLEGEQGDPDEALRLLEEARAVFGRCGHRRAEALVWLNLGTRHLRCRQLAEADACYEAAERLYRDLHDPRRRAMLGCNRAGVHHLRGEVEAARREALDALSIAEAADQRPLAAEALDLLARLDLEQGQPARARARIVRGLELAPAAGAIRLELLGALASVELALGDRAAARAALELGDRVSNALGNPLRRCDYLCCRATVLAGCGASAEAERALAQAEALWAAQTFPEGSALDRNLRAARAAVSAAGAHNPGAD